MKFTGTAIRVLAVLSLALAIGCTATPTKKVVEEKNPFGDDSPEMQALLQGLGLGKNTGLPQHDENSHSHPHAFTDKVNMLYRDSKTGVWQDTIIKVNQIPGYRAAMCFKDDPGNLADCFYMTDAGDVKFLVTDIDGYAET